MTPQNIGSALGAVALLIGTPIAFVVLAKNVGAGAAWGALAALLIASFVVTMRR